jgi:hypothetical protein
VLSERLPNALIRCADVTRDDLSDLGQFDRVLVYAALHYVTSAAEGERFVHRALSLLAPGGRALFGNLPLPVADLPHSWLQRAFGRGWTGLRRIARQLGHRPARADPSSMPAGYCLPLTRDLIEGWLRPVPDVSWRWVPPRVGVPLMRSRADLIVEKSP